MLSQYHIEQLAKAVHTDMHDDGLNERMYQVGKLLFVVEYYYAQYLAGRGSYYTPPDYEFCISVINIGVWIGPHLVCLDIDDINAVQQYLEEYFGYESLRE